MMYLLSRGQACVYSITYFVYKAHSEYFLQGAPRHSDSSKRVADTSDVIHEVDATGRKMNSVLNQKDDVKESDAVGATSSLAG